MPRKKWFSGSRYPPWPRGACRIDPATRPSKKAVAAIMKEARTACITGMLGILGYFHAFPGSEVFTRYDRAMGAFQDHYPDNVAHCYGCGSRNPHGLHVKSFWHEDGVHVIAEHVPDARYCGWPDLVYGGLIAMLGGLLEKE